MLCHRSTIDLPMAPKPINPTRVIRPVLAIDALAAMRGWCKVSKKAGGRSRRDFESRCCRIRNSPADQQREPRGDHLGGAAVAPSVSTSCSIKALTTFGKRCLRKAMTSIVVLVNTG